MADSSSALVVEALPDDLRRPMLIVAFAGWNDAAESATSAARFLVQQWSARRVARIDPEEFFNFSLTRPEVRFLPGSTVREVRWPTVDFSLGQDPALPRDVVMAIGTEPHLKWQTFCGHVLEFIRRAGVELVITFGALLADVPHTRPIRISGVATDPELAGLFQTTATRYEGPTGIIGVLNDACRRAGVPAVSLWANVPHYVSEVSNPHAILALVQRVLGFLEVSADLSDLNESAADFDQQLARVVAQKPEVARYIQELERRDARAEPAEGQTTGDLPSGSDLMHEVEQFLRHHRGDPEKGNGE
ncbi:MAG TPA: PAC2 family protein [Candidatus Sulfotelmatobacter sp.]|nr:PAC2 family protein [Candidatus Sulfotelmatobacter sp.]